MEFTLPFLMEGRRDGGRWFGLGSCSDFACLGDKYLAYSGAIKMMFYFDK